MAANTMIRSGQVLIAEPFMLDPYFRRSVVLLCEHHNEGTIGFILNKNIEMGINDLMSDFPPFDAEIFYGGPVQTDTLHYVHNLGNQLDDSVKIAEGVWWGGDFDQLKMLVSQQKIDSSNIRFFVGYSGWSAGQLKDEVEYGSWVPGEMDANYIFKLKPNRLWRQIMYNKGDIFEILSDMPENISWN